MKHFQFAQEKITMLDGETPCTLSMSITKHASLPEFIKNENPEVFIKEEIIGFGERISVEVQTEGEKINLIKCWQLRLLLYWFYLGHPALG